MYWMEVALPLVAGLKPACTGPVTFGRRFALPVNPLRRGVEVQRVAGLRLFDQRNLPALLQPVAFERKRRRCR